MTTTRQQGALQKANAQPKQKTIKDYIQIYSKEIEKALPSVMTPERFTRIMTSAVSNNKKLADCDPLSFISAMMTSAQLGLEANTPLGQAYLIPYGRQCQFQIGYKGLIDLAYRSGQVKTVMAQVVYENDEFDFEFGLEPKLKHIPAKSNRGKAIWYYAVFKLVNGGEGFEVMSYEDVMEHAKKYSKTFNNGPWQTNFDEMAKKTVLKKALKCAPLHSDFVKQVSTDETVKTVISDHMEDVPSDYIDAEAIEKEDVKVDEETGEIIL